ncbi:MAG: hypothetical protein RIA65_04670, partial [Woeseia sp.]
MSDPDECASAAAGELPMLCIAHLPHAAVPALAERFGLGVTFVADNQPITGSFWGEPEAGVVGTTLYVRGDTPLHSALHELSHLVCMSASRRAALVRDAGGDDDEESAVCYLQILLADEIDGAGRERLMKDMNGWGYSFRLGSTELWFRDDAHDAARWLQVHGVLDKDN